MNQKTSLLGVFSVCSGALALTLALIVVKSQTEMVASSEGRWATMQTGDQVMTAAAMLFALLSILTGIVLSVNSREYRSWGITGVVLGALPLIFSISVVGYVVTKRVVSMKNMITKVKTGGTVSPYVGKPIPAGKEAYTWNQERESYRRYYQKHFIQGYQTHGVRSPAWDASVETYLRNWIARKVKDPDAPDAKVMFESSRKILAAGCQDPLFLYLADDLQAENGEKARLIWLAQTQVEKSGYSASVKFIIELLANYWHQQFRTAGYNFAQSDQRALEYLRQSFIQGDYQPDEYVLLHFRLLQNPGAAWAARLGDQFCNTLERTPECPPWIGKLYRGKYEVQLAWRARGTGYAGTVSERGWQEYYEHLRRAEAELAGSWELNPKDPYAAAEMITVKMGSPDGSTEDLRRWFDRSVAAQLDHYPAYNNFLWALRPRWNGSHEEMLKFGEACLQTGRFDTEIPQYYVKTVHDVSSELGNWDLYREPAVYQNIRKAFDGGAAADTSEWKGRSFQTGNMMLASRADKLEDAGKDLALLKDKPVIETMLTWLDNSEMSAGWIKVWNSPHKDLLLQIQAAADKRNFTEVLDGAEKLKNLVQDDPFLKKWSEDYIAAKKLDAELSSGQWVPLKIGKNFDGWSSYNGEWKINADGSIDGASGINGSMLKSLEQIGPNFAIKGEVEMLSSTTGDYQAGILFGNLHPSVANWYSFRIMHSGRDGDVAVLSRAFANELRRIPVKLQKNNSFELSFAGGEITATVNNARLISSLALQKDASQISACMTAGLGSYSFQNEFAVRYRNVQIRRLTPTGQPLALTK